MVCSISCTLAFAFIIASIYTCMFSDKKELHKKYMALLDNTKKLKYKKIVQERKSIYFNKSNYLKTLHQLILKQNQNDNYTAYSYIFLTTLVFLPGYLHALSCSHF